MAARAVCALSRPAICCSAATAGSRYAPRPLPPAGPPQAEDRPPVPVSAGRRVWSAYFETCHLSSPRRHWDGSATEQGKLGENNRGNFGSARRSLGQIGALSRLSRRPSGCASCRRGGGGGAHPLTAGCWRLRLAGCSCYHFSTRLAAGTRGDACRRPIGRRPPLATPPPPTTSSAPPPLPPYSQRRRPAAERQSRPAADNMEMRAPGHHKDMSITCDARLYRIYTAAAAVAPAG
ncbi:WAS/WASL-interacting protein family member 3-like [Schistocerca cancellata]|uniref:WAS/WASL-interacting protein family member 3-like n=1 Tax=Schistocerca cancellata TaxID=274614 RepID=UPI002117E4A8|nr:WAS/WASL-interacting protein family member 3-like [Schistocerca cancellata]